MTDASLPPVIAAVLNGYSRQIAAGEITSATPHAGFSGAGVWKIVTPNSAWALRRWPAQGLPAIRIRGLHRLLEHLRQQEIDFIAAPIPSDLGHTLHRNDESLWQLEPWLPGIADFHHHPGELRLKAALAALARWHRAAGSFLPVHDSREWFGSTTAPSPAVQERLTKLRQISREHFAEWKRGIQQLPAEETRTLCEDICRRLPTWIPIISAELSAVQHEPFALQPCLRDVWHDHLLFTDDVVTGLIDASACRTENITTDLARLIGSLIEDDTAGWKIALQTYRELRPLSLAEEALIISLDRSGVLLSGITWLNWLGVERRNFPDQHAMLNRLRHWHRRLTALDQSRGW